MDIATLEKPEADEAVRVDEGISRGDSVRARMLFLVSQNNTLVNQTQFADAKAGALMTVLLLISTKGAAPGISVIQDPVELASMVLVILSIGFCLATIMPRVMGFRTDSMPPQNERYTWLYMAMPEYSKEQHGAFARQAEFGALLNSVASSNVGASRVLAKKFAMLRWAFITGLAGCALLLLAVNF